MLDIRLIGQDPEAFQARLERRGGTLDLSMALNLDARRRALIARTDQLRHEKAVAEKDMRRVEQSSPEFAAFRDRMRAVAGEIKATADELRAAEIALTAAVEELPNLPDDAVPDGESAEHNPVLRTWGEPPQLDFEPREHWAIGEQHGWLDFERAAKISGARFAVYRGPLARLERALIQFMLDLHTERHGYLEILPPFVVNEASMRGTGQFPKMRDEAFLVERDGLVLIPTAEVPLTNLHRDEILAADALPLRYTAYSPCFRREAGGYGRDTRGLVRLHQFQKVELVQFVAPEDSEAAHLALTGHAEAVLQRLELPYRVVDLCAGDLGATAARTFDLEVWLPGQGAYREISSCSNFRDFQARRAAIRYRPAPGEKPRLVHTLNGSGLAVGRTVVALLENGQDAQGRIRLPTALRPYLGGAEFLGQDP